MVELNPSQELISLQDAFVDLAIKENPIVGPMFGIDKYPDEIFQVSQEFHIESISQLERIRSRTKELSINSTLSNEEKADLAFLVDAVDVSCT